jgi:hypothetical protein
LMTGTNVGQQLLDRFGFGWWRGGHGGNGSGRKVDKERWWWELVVVCSTPAVEKIDSEYQDVMTRGIRAKCKVTPSQFGEDQFLLDSFQLSSALYSRLTQS